MLTPLYTEKPKYPVMSYRPAFMMHFGDVRKLSLLTKPL